MKRGTKITHKAYPFNSDGDHDINFPNVEFSSEDEYNAIFDDPTYFFMQIHKGVIYGVNKLKFKGKRFTLLEPNPVNFYYSIAFDTSNQIEDAYRQLENSLSNPNKSWPLAVSHSYVFRVKSISVIFAFSSCEAFLNQTLPDFKKISFPGGKSYSKQEIERYMGFEKKVKAVSIHMQKDFTTLHPHKFKRLVELKELRDKLIHLKEVKQGIAVSYNNIYQSILDVDIKRIINTVKAFINFYEPNLIVNYTYQKNSV